MKKLIFLLLILIACQKESTTFTEGVSVNHQGTDLLFNFKLTDSGHSETNLPIIGNLNYKESGANFVINGMTLTPQYFIMMADSSYQVHRLKGMSIVAGKWYNLRIQASPLIWWVDGAVVAGSNLGVGKEWITSAVDEMENCILSF